MDARAFVRDPLLVHLDAIDRAWSQRQPIDIRQLICQLGPTITAEEQADLLAADLEWRWRSAGLPRLATTAIGRNHSQIS